MNTNHIKSKCNFSHSLPLIVLWLIGCESNPTNMSVTSNGCYPGESCVEYQGTGPSGETGFGDPICILSPTSDVPLNISQGYSSQHKAHDVVGTQIKAIFDGTIRAEYGMYGSWGCYSTGLCYGSTTCPCVSDPQNKDMHITQCLPAATNYYYSGGSYSYGAGSACYIEACGSDMCQNKERPCHNQVTLESSDGNYRFRVLHIKELLVNKGDTVKAGTPIAVIGNTGWSCSSSENGMGIHGHMNLYEYDKDKKVWGLLSNWPSWVSKDCKQQASCGNSKCEAGEDCNTCIQDCACQGGLTCMNGSCAMPMPTWRVVNSGTNFQLFAVWGSAGTDFWATGSNGTFIRWNGSNWNPVTSSSFSSFRGIWGSGKNDIWAVGSGPTILRWSGVNWATVPPGPNPLYGVFGTASDDVWAVGGNGSTVLHWNGSNWLTSELGANNTILQGIWAANRSDAWAVGFDAVTLASVMLRWNGSVWANIGSGTGNALRAIRGISSSDVWAVGENGTIIRWNGSSWNAISSSVNAPLFGIWVISSNDAWAVGQSGTILHWNGTGWSRSNSPITENLRAIWGVSSSDIWAVGDNGTTIHYSP